MVKKKMIVLAFVLGFFSVQHMNAEKTGTVSSVIGSVRNQTNSMWTWSKTNKWYIALPTLVAVTTAAVLYQYNQSFKNSVDSMFGLKEPKPTPVVKPAQPKPRPRPNQKPRTPNE